MASYKCIYTICAPYLGAFVEMLKLYKDNPAIVLLILDIYHDFAQYQLDFLPEPEAGVVLEACMLLFQTYDACGLGTLLELFGGFFFLLLYFLTSRTKVNEFQRFPQHN